MALTIYKYPVTPEMVLPLPKEAKPLTVHIQHGTPQLWVLLNPEAPAIPRKFVVHGTGHTIHTASLLYIGTFQLERGRLVFHLFEECDPY